MRRIKKALLGLVTVMSPVVLAACYGPAYKEIEFSGKVVDRETKAGVSGARVECLVDGEALSTVHSGVDGVFNLASPIPCDAFRVIDVDAGANGGPYQEQTVPAVDAGDQLSFELEKN